MTALAHVAAVVAGLAILAAVHADIAILLNGRLLKRACVAIGLAIAGALLIAASRTLS